jgi:pSer/pThr/pTyr-binding forkhead associated (FHA) protein
VFTPVTWTVTVAPDRVYYDRMRVTMHLSDAVTFPAHHDARRYPLSGKQVRIGRSSASRDLKPEIDLAGPHADPGISRQHAVLIARPDDTWAVVDSGSANGTLLNGRKIEVGDEIPLRDGDRINLGAWTVIAMHRA